MASADKVKVQTREVQSLIEKRKLLFLKARELDNLKKLLKDKTMQVSRQRNVISNKMLKIQDAISTKVNKN